ncbi:MAG: M15 family metallopeptidase [Hyphomicrobiaceae bacterium]
MAFRLLASGGIAAGEVSSSLTAQEQLKLATDRLPRGYPGIVKSVENGEVIFGDGARLPLGVGNRPKSFQQWLSHPDILDMFALEYPESPLTAPPPANFDPGRARNAAFFKKVYGDCAKGAVTPTLVAVNWLPKKAGQMLKVTSINGVARQLEAVSAELDALPADFDVFLYPAAGTYNCRDIAGTTTPSAHGYGIAIDIAVQRASYWRWSGAKGDTAPAWRNEVPMEIVRVFEKHGFIWGGKWNHFDTMHFEYRPELLPPSEGPALRSGAQK